MKTEDITGVLLAGGKSRRMGIDKRRIVVNGQPLIERVLSVLETLFSEVLVVIAEDDLIIQSDHSQVVRDLIPCCATAGGLFTGLSSAQRDVVFVAGCDMPFLQSQLIAHMASLIETADITVAKLTSGIQPLHGFYRKTCLSALEKRIRSGDLTLQHLFDDDFLSTQYVDEASLREIDRHLMSFMNVNTPADLEMARKFQQH